MSFFKANYFSYIKELFHLAFPLIIGNLGVILVGAGDVFVAAKHSTDTLAAISIANSIISSIILFGIGLLASISPILSNFRGKKFKVKKFFLPTISFAMTIAFISTIVILLFIPIIDILNFPQNLTPDIKKYMLICAFSTFGAYLQIALKEFLQAYEIVIFPNFLNFFCVFVNLLLDFIFVFGLIGFPEMGAIGLAIATVISRSLMGLILLSFCLFIIKVQKYKNFRYWKLAFGIGFPIAMATFLEAIAFNIITIFVGRISGDYAAAQNILLTLSTATFMIPLAISTAIAIKVGYNNGAKNYIELKRYAISGIFVSVLFMSVCAILFITTPKFFVNIFTNDKNLVNICIPIMMIMGLFQIFDGLQVSLGGVFKGLKNTKIVMIGNFIAYWVIGLPLGYYLAFQKKMNLFGFWVGLAISLFLLALILLNILIFNSRLSKKAPAF